MVVTKV